MTEFNLNRFDKIGLLVIGLTVGFSIGVAVASWNWFPDEPWYYNPIAIIPQTALSCFALLSPFIVVLVFLLIRRRISRVDI